MTEITAANPYLIIAAVLPAAVLLFYIYKKDRLEKEPVKLLLKLVLWGIISTAMAQITETIGMYVLGAVFVEDSLIYNLLLYFIVVALSEEGFKYILLKWKTWKNPEFNCHFDGLVYAVCVSLGFALWENILYVASYGFSTAVARAVTAVPGHACFGVFMGSFYGSAKRAELQNDPEKSKTLRLSALIAPVLLHGAYDFLATEIERIGFWLFLVFIAALFFFAFKTVNSMSKGDHFIVQNPAPQYGSEMRNNYMDNNDNPYGRL